MANAASPELFCVHSDPFQFQWEVFAFSPAFM